jgi:hypothetical protein
MLRMGRLMMMLSAPPMTMRRLMARMMLSPTTLSQSMSRTGSLTMISICTLLAALPNMMPSTLIRMRIWTSLASQVLRLDGELEEEGHEQLVLMARLMFSPTALPKSISRKLGADGVHQERHDIFCRRAHSLAIVQMRRSIQDSVRDPWA